MARFAPLGVSFFDREFTLDPFPFIEPLYEREDLLGFESEGMKFCFRFTDCHSLIGAHKHVAREPVATEETARAQAAFAARFPTRAWHFQYSLVDVKCKALLNHVLLDLLERIQAEDVGPVFQILARPGRHEDYLQEVGLLPMRILLRAWGFRFDEPRLQTLYDDSIALVKSS